MRRVKVIAVPVIISSLLFGVAFGQDIPSRIVDLIFLAQKFSGDELFLTALLDLAEADRALSTANTEIVRGASALDSVNFETAVVVIRDVEIARKYTSDALRIFSELRASGQELQLSTEFMDFLRASDFPTPLDAFQPATEALDNCLASFLSAESQEPQRLGACLETSGRLRDAIALALGYGSVPTF